jgi:hypothetical protein
MLYPPKFHEMITTPYDRLEMNLTAGVFELPLYCNTVGRFL